MLTFICWNLKKLLPTSPVDTAMHHSKYYLLKVQLTTADSCSKLFARSLINCCIILGHRILGHRFCQLEPHPVVPSTAVLVERLATSTV